MLQAMAEVHLLMRTADGRARAVRRAARAAADQPQALERARRRAASGGQLRGRRRRAIGARSRRSRRTRSRTTISASSLYHRGAIDEARSTAFRAALDVAADVRQGAAQPRAAAQPRKAISARRSRRIGRCSTVEPEHPVAWNGIGLVLAELRKFEDARNAFARAIQRAPELRGSALQHELHALEPRRLRGRAARDEARAGARSVLRRAEVRAGDGRRVRGSRSLDSARISAAPSARRRTIADFSFDSAVARHAVHRARAGNPCACAGAAEAGCSRARIRRTSSRWRTTICQGLLRSRGGRGQSCARARRARAEGYALLGDIFMRAGAVRRSARALSRSARLAAPSDPKLLVGEACSLLAMGRATRRGRLPKRCSRSTASRSRC